MAENDLFTVNEVFKTVIKLYYITTCVNLQTKLQERAPEEEQSMVADHKHTVRVTP